jgi:ribonuclease P protein component
MRSAGSRPLVRLTLRREFLRAARGRTVAAGGLVLQAQKRPPGEIADDGFRIGYTASKKVGNAVQRNRARRRLRAVANDVLTLKGEAGTDYVLIARNTTAQRTYDELLADLTGALDRLARGGGEQRRHKGRSGARR